jgi:hypothetical protein
MLAYTVTATFDDPRIADEWIDWLRNGHVQEVIAGGATVATIVKMEGPERCVEVRYHFPDRKALDEYERNHAPRLRAEGLQRFPTSRGITYRRSIGSVEFAKSRDHPP